MPTIYTVTVGEAIGDALVNVPVNSEINFVLAAASPIALRRPRLKTNYPNHTSFTELPAYVLFPFHKTFRILSLKKKF